MFNITFFFYFTCAVCCLYIIFFSTASFFTTASYVIVVWNTFPHWKKFFFIYILYRDFFFFFASKYVCTSLYVVCTIQYTKAQANHVKIKTKEKYFVKRKTKEKKNQTIWNFVPHRPIKNVCWSLCAHAFIKTMSTYITNEQKKLLS